MGGRGENYILNLRIFEDEFPVSGPVSMNTTAVYSIPSTRPSANSRIMQSSPVFLIVLEWFMDWLSSDLIIIVYEMF